MSRNVLAGRMIDAVFEICRRFERDGFEAIKPQYDALHRFQGKPVRIVAGSGVGHGSRGRASRSTERCGWTRRPACASSTGVRYRCGGDTAGRLRRAGRRHRQHAYEVALGGRAMERPRASIRPPCRRGRGGFASRAWRAVARRSASASRSAYGVPVEFATTTALLAGVTCGYDDPPLLGVDRWLALVAAWDAVRQPVAVVDLGTAATLDFVTGAGQHLGGYIVPGLGLMAAALARDTAGVRVAGDLAPELLPGRNTAQAVRRGATAMLLDFLEACCCPVRARLLASPPRVFLTGGDAELVAGRLSFAPRVEPDLVLDGLGLALP